MDEVPVVERTVAALTDDRVHSSRRSVGMWRQPRWRRRRTRVTGYVRHSAVLPHADVIVCHAGLGTITSALTFGVPLLLRAPGDATSTTTPHASKNSEPA